ncbi:MULTISPECIES: 7TM domain-containing protein [unclassified Bradyrhizobium]|uniref:7TM domain-containing protein n=1 Tax=Bradyrhizobium sp. USDA 4541 TaxID=2817704 RepID=UPI0020A278A3|nr:7TM domain-containing protein [Bradyrhizobium sp. USDA 4541]MCP1850161.1 hypothetical protein [Bradyrhizobium sp. USDA 4541]
MNGTCKNDDAQAAAALKTDWLLVGLFALPLGIALSKLPMLPTSSICSSFFSLTELPAQFYKSAESVLFVSLGAVVVVLFRLTLGVKVLGLFRPILTAIGFDIIGIPIGLAFLLLVLLVTVALLPLLKTDHSYARIAVLLSVAAALLDAPLLAGNWWDIAWLREIALFPVIALCLTCESFAKVLGEDGVYEAVWRTFTTVLAALTIVTVMSLPGALGIYLRFPELLLVQAGCILLINEYLDFRLLEGANPLAAWRRGQLSAVRPAELLPLHQADPTERLDSGQTQGRKQSCG